MTEIRRHFKTINTGSEILRELLQNIFISELLKPSKNPVWLVSPWMSNVAIIDNRSGCFDIINPDWRGQFVKLEDIILHMYSVDTELNIVTNKDEHNDYFLTNLKRRLSDFDKKNNIIIKQRERLHLKKCLVNDYGTISGSMNITFNGIHINDEEIIYSINRAHIDEDRQILEREYGGHDDD